MLQALRQDLASGWAWLDVAGLVPTPLRRLLGADRRPWILDLSEETPTLIGQDQGQRTSLSDNAATTLRRHRVDADRLILRPPSAAVLRKTVDLPDAAADSLDQVLRFEMDRLTPFREEDVYFGWRIVGRHPAERRITVEIDLVPRTAAREAIERARGLGADPIGLELGPHGSVHPLRPADAMVGHLRRLQMVLLGVLSLLVVAAGWAELDRRQSLLDVARAGLAAAKADAERADSIRARLETGLRRASFVVDRRIERPTTVEILNELSRLLPDHSTLGQFRLQEDQIEISGTSRSVTEIVRQLEGSRLFGDIVYRSSVTKDTRDGVDRFHLSFRLRKAAG